jgi:superfamily II DNA or RNA helicase
MQLRPYQDDAVKAILGQWDSGNNRTLMVLPTGTGKTIVFAKAAEHEVREGRRVLILAHRGELLEQAADKLQRATGLGCAVEKAEQTCMDEWFRVVVGSVQSLQRPQRLAKFDRDYFDTIIVDECHHALAEGYQAVLRHFDGARVLGVTATPDRGDMRELGEYFDSLAYEYTLPKAIKDGFLSPIKALTIPIKLDLRGVGVQAGDFKSADIGNALDPYLEQIADEMAEHCAGRKTLVFLPLISTSQKFCAMLKARGMRAAEVNGMSPDRREIIRDFDSGRYDICTNSMLLTEGFDCPSIDCVVMLRPTKIRSLYCQCIGRGTRIHPGKTHLLLLDFLWLSERHELCRPAHLIAQTPEVAAKMTANIADAGAAVDLEEAELRAESDCVAERESALAKQLAEMRNRKKKLVDPLQYEMSIQAEDLANYIPAFGWEMAPPSERQKEQLEHAGIEPELIESAGKASLLIDRINKRRAAGLATPKQIRFLEGKGFQHVGTWEFEQARKTIDRIAAHKWRVPAGIDPATYAPAPTQRELAL